MSDDKAIVTSQDEKDEDIFSSPEDIDELMAELTDKGLEEEDRANIIKRVRQVVVSRSGPLPPAEEIAGYERVLRGSADRIILMAEKQSDHRRRMEELQVGCATEAIKETHRFEYRLSLFGSIFAFIICITVVIVGGICIINGNSITGFGSIFLGLGSIIGAFIYIRRKPSISPDLDDDGEREA